MTPTDLVGSATARQPVPMVAEISLLTAVPSLELWELWQRTERDEPPFWAYPWAGGQALARYILDHPGIVAGRRVLDVASGSGWRGAKNRSKKPSMCRFRRAWFDALMEPRPPGPDQPVSQPATQTGRRRRCAS